MNKYGFKSVLSEQLEGYILDFEARGNCIKRTLYIIKEFDAFLAEQRLSEPCFSIELYEKWLSTFKGLSSSTICRKASFVRSFAIYLTKMGFCCAIPRLPKHRTSNYVPYIFTKDEMRKIFEVCDKMVAPCRTLTSIMITMPSLLRLLYSTAIRIGEALSIRNRDVDFSRHIIYLSQTKNGHDRLAPINPTLEGVLRQYIHFRNQIPIKDIDAPENYLFVSLRGKRVSHRAVFENFKKILDTAGIVDAYNSKLPRLHDIRHTACIHAMHKLLSKEKDLYCHLPILATFMGHLNVSDTEYYLRLAQQYYPDLVKQQVSLVEPITGIINRALIIKQDDYV